MLSGISCRSTSESSADLKHKQTSQKLDTAVFGCDHGKSCEGIAGITAVESWEYTVLVEQVKSWEFFASSVLSLQENKCGKMSLFLHCCVTFPGIPSRLVGAHSPQTQD